MSLFPADQAERKRVRLHAGVDRYFPSALIGVADVSDFGNRKHNPIATELFDDRSKSNDDMECLRRHLWDHEMGDGYDADSGRPAIFHAAWRVLRMAQKWAESNGSPIAPAARNAITATVINTAEVGPVHVDAATDADVAAYAPPNTPPTVPVAD